MIVFVRHGESEYNRKGLHQGQFDSPLTEDGKNQARSLKEILSKYTFDRIICSPLSRTKVTAEIINENFNIPITFDDGLLEIDKGSFSGTYYKDYEKIKKFKANPKLYGAETKQEFYDRCIKAYKEIEKLDGNTLIVSHGGVYICIYKYLNNLDIDEKIHVLGNCEVYVCEKE